MTQPSNPYDPVLNPKPVFYVRSEVNPSAAGPRVLHHVELAHGQPWHTSRKRASAAYLCTLLNSAHHHGWYSGAAVACHVAATQLRGPTDDSANEPSSDPIDDSPTQA